MIIKAGDLYEKAAEAMPPEQIAHWCSDLYLKVTPYSKELIENYEFKNQVRVFQDEITKTPWYDIPFAYTGEKWRG